MKRKIQNLVTRNQNLIEENLRLKKEIKLVKSPKHRKTVATAEFKKYFSVKYQKMFIDFKILSVTVIITDLPLFSKKIFF